VTRKSRIAQARLRSVPTGDARRIPPEGHVDDVGCWCGPTVDPVAGLMHQLVADD
jgi:hypothetical protein